MTYYKVLARGHRACHGGTHRYTPGRWTRRIADTKARVRGWHVCTVDTLARWLYADSDDQLPLEVWECEVENPTDAGNKYVCERIRLTRLVGTLDEYDLRWLATEFAIGVLSNTDIPDIRAAWVAAWSAAFVAAWSATRSAAWSAAGRTTLDYLEG